MPKRKANESNETNVKKKNPKIKIETKDDDSIGSLTSEESDNDVANDANTKPKDADNRLSSSGEGFRTKIFSWNVNGLRAVLKKFAFNSIDTENADIVCLQEIKCHQNEDIPKEFHNWNKYPHKYWCFAKTKGYSGVCLLSKEEPINVKMGIDIEEHDSEGRVITAEYEKYYVVTAYVPNSGRGLVRLDYRMKWDSDFREYLKKLDSKKPIILCGDLNVSHKEIDLENPKTNTKTAGFTPQEREEFTKLLNEGFIDSFRELYPNAKKCYTFWSYLRNARQKDIGWRLDYFVMSKRINDKLCNNKISSQVMGSDHCPIVLTIAL